jgi:hypothetical protein
VKTGYKAKPPFTVDVVDQFEGHCEDGYWTEGTYETLDAAIAVARKITEDAIKQSGSVKQWDGMGDAGLVYDANGRKIWDGITEASAGRLGAGD